MILREGFTAAYLRLGFVGVLVSDASGLVELFMGISLGNCFCVVSMDVLFAFGFVLSVCWLVWWDLVWLFGWGGLLLCFAVG